MKTVELLVNNSAISTAACDRKYQLTCVWGVRTPERDTATLGKAFHRIAQLYIQRDVKGPGDQVAIVQQACEEFSLHHEADKLMRCATAFSASRRRLPPVIIHPDKGPFVETKFRVKYKDVEYKDVLYQVYLVGTIDYIGYKDCVQLVDYKTFAGKAVSDKLAEYAMKFQLSFYAWVLHKYSRELGLPANIAVECDASLIQARYAIMPHNLPSPSLSIGNPQPFNRTYFEECEVIVENAITNMIAIHSLGESLAVRSGMTNGECKYCYFAAACISRNLERELEFINSLERSPYDPASFN